MTDTLFDLPNQIQNVPNGQQLGLYVRYPSRQPNEESRWIPFKMTEYNTHQVNALKQFIKSGEEEKKICVPHAQGDLFEATFRRGNRINENYNHLYTYTRQDGSYVQMMVSYPGLIGFINRITTM